jgi:hypothetical protein
MTDGGGPARAAEIYGYVRGRWLLLDAVADAPRDAVIRRGRTHLSRPEVEAVRILVERADGPVPGRLFVAYRAQKSDVPEPDLPALRPAAGPTDEVPDGPPPIPPPLVPAQPPEGRLSGRRAARFALAGTATLCLGFLAMRHGIQGGTDPYGLAPSATAVAVMIGAGLLLVRDMTRLELPATGMPEDAGNGNDTEDGEDTEEPPPVPAPPDDVPPAGFSPMDTPPVLLPVLRLLADALARIDGDMPEPVSDEATRLGVRLYTAGAADGQAARAGGAAGRDPVTDCLLLLGEQEGEAARFAAALDDLLLGPEAQALYRAGREDLAALADGGGPGGSRLGPALARWIEAAATGDRSGDLTVLAVAPLPPAHAPVVEAVVGTFGGHGFSRDGTAVTAGFTSAQAALDAAHAIRDAVRTGPRPSGTVPGCALTIAARPRPGGSLPAPAASAALALARAAPGKVSVTPVLRAVLAARGAAPA